MRSRSLFWVGGCWYRRITFLRTSFINIITFYEGTSTRLATYTGVCVIVDIGIVFDILRSLSTSLLMYRSFSRSFWRGNCQGFDSYMISSSRLVSGVLAFRTLLSCCCNVLTSLSAFAIQHRCGGSMVATFLRLKINPSKITNIVHL